MKSVVSESLGARILLVDDDRSFLVSVRALLEDEGGYQVECAYSVDHALEVLADVPSVRVIVSDLSMPGRDGIELLEVVRRQVPDVSFLLMTAHGSIETAVKAMRLGAFQYLTKPIDPDEMLVQISRALEVASAKEHFRALKERYGDPDFTDVLIGESAGMRALGQAIEDLARVDSTVMIRGETGTGKELVARLIHRASPRARRPLGVVNCTAIPRDLLESELFGHEKGAFTGATGLRRGRIEEAEGGALLLDEVGDMALDLQPKLLRFLQERTYRRVGGGRELAADVRIMAATHRDLEQAMEKGDFRRDLFYRLNTIPLTIPPLRERLEDLPSLCEHLVGTICLRLRRAPRPVSTSSLEVLAQHDFPGNVRELENLLERGLVLGGVGGPQDAFEVGSVSPMVGEQEQRLDNLPLEGGMAAIQRLTTGAEKRLIERALKAWPSLPNRSVAERLGTNRRVLELRMKEYGITKADS